MIQLSSLTYFPIKSCRGFDVDTAVVQRSGLARDRQMMVVTPEGKHLTQRAHHRLALVVPALADDCIQLSAPDFDAIQILIRTSGPAMSVDIWDSKGVQALDQGDKAASWFSTWLNADVRLVHIANDYRRLVDPQYAVHADDHTAFTDGFPILIASEGSLSDLNGRLQTPIPMNRFRPNLVVSGCEPFAEDSWKRIRIGDLEMAVVKSCARCLVTTIDKVTLKSSKEPLRTLATFRKQKRGVMFGQNVIPLGEGSLEVGMQVEILA